MASAETEERIPTVPRARKRLHPDFMWINAGLATAIGGTGLVVAFLMVWWQLVESTNRRHADALLAATERSYVAYFDSRIADLNHTVARLAAWPPVAQALAAGDPAALEPLSARMAQTVPYALRVVVVPRGEAKVDLKHEIPISYAALDMIRRAEFEPIVGPEVSLSQRSQVAIAAPVNDGGLNVGVLFLVVAIEYFSEPLRAFDLSAGQIRIQQAFTDAEPTIVMQFGTPGAEAQRRISRLDAPHWQLLFDPGTALATPLASAASLAGPLALAVALLIGGILLAAARQRRKLDADVTTFTAYATRLLSQREADPGTFHLRPFRTAAAELAKFARPGAEPAGTKPARRRAAVTAVTTVGTASEPDDPTADDFLEVNVAADAAQNFGIEVDEQQTGAQVKEPAAAVEDEIFRAYDIRGIVERNLGEEVVYWIGRAFAAEARAQGQQRAVVGGDGRLSSPILKAALARGLNEGGVDVVDIGEVPTPVLYFATHHLGTGTGIMITGSHNPPEYNGLKMVIDGITLAEGRITALRDRIRSRNLSEGSGSLEERDMVEPYLDRILEDVAVAQPLKVVVDCGNGVAGAVAPRLIAALGCEVVPLYCTVDGTFPNHHPDPAEPENLEDLITVVKAEGAHLGLAFDGDGDRLGVVTNKGEIVWPDKLLMLFAQDVVGRNPGSDVIYDVKCSRHLSALIGDLGGRPIMWKTGHSHIKAKIRETGALLAGEFSGHICFGERWFGFDDAIYSAARLLEILGTEDRTVAEIFAAYPATFTTPEIKIKTTEAAKFQIMERLKREADFGNGTLTDIDGIRIDYDDGWGLIRPSNTSPVLVLRFEADTPDALERIRGVFRARLAAIDPGLAF